MERSIGAKYTNLNRVIKLKEKRLLKIILLHRSRLFQIFVDIFFFFPSTFFRIQKFSLQSTLEESTRNKQLTLLWPIFLLVLITLLRHYTIHRELYFHAFPTDIIIYNIIAYLYSKFNYVSILMPLFFLVLVYH